MYLGIDLGGSTLDIGFVSTGGEVEKYQRIDIGDHKARGSDLFALLYETLDHHRDSHRGSLHTGLGLPAVIAEEELSLISNIPNFSLSNFIQKVKKDFGLVLHPFNDVKCATIGESWIGALKGAENALFVNLGSGVSVGMILSGRLHLGAHQASGEIAYALSSPSELGCFSDGILALESRIGGLSIKEKIAQHFTENLSVKELLICYGQGDKKAQRILDPVFSLLSMHLVNLCLLLDIEHIVFGGGMSLSSDLFFPILLRHLRSSVPYPPQLSCSSLQGRAGLIGAARHAMEKSGEL